MLFEMLGRVAAPRWVLSSCSGDSGMLAKDGVVGLEKKFRSRYKRLAESGSSSEYEGALRGALDALPKQVMPELLRALSDSQPSTPIRKESS